MGNCCYNKNYFEFEIVQCQNISDINKLLEDKIKYLSIEKENNNISYNNESDRSNKNILNKNINDTENIIKEYERMINLLNKYEKKIRSIPKIKHIIDNINKYEKQKDYASIKFIIDGFENYCISHY